MESKQNAGNAQDCSRARQIACCTHKIAHALYMESKQNAGNAQDCSRARQIACCTHKIARALYMESKQSAGRMRRPLEGHLLAG